MPRRIHIPRLSVGVIALDEIQSHHARDVLRLANGTLVELFDDAGAIGEGVVHWDAPGPRVDVRSITPAPESVGITFTLVAAVPKGDRADWMVEKLSELGAAAFIPLAADRSVVLPEGKSKHDRWVRIATEAAKQSRRRGVMRIEPLTKLRSVIADAETKLCCLSTEPGATPFAEMTFQGDMTVLIGPEGGWSEAEIRLFDDAGIRRISLGTNILRIETAAIAIAAILIAKSESNFNP